MHKIRGTLRMHVLTVGKNHIFMSLLFYLPSTTSLTGTKFRLDCPCHVVCLTLEYHSQVYTVVFCKPRSYMLGSLYFYLWDNKNSTFLQQVRVHAVNIGAAVPELSIFSTFIQTHKSMYFMPCLNHACMHARQHERESNANERCPACL